MQLYLSFASALLALQPAMAQSLTFYLGNFTSFSESGPGGDDTFKVGAWITTDSSETGVCNDATLPPQYQTVNGTADPNGIDFCGYNLCGDTTLGQGGNCIRVDGPWPPSGEWFAQLHSNTGDASGHCEYQYSVSYDCSDAGTSSTYEQQLVCYLDGSC
ncbi:MAG: hypothetical protein Q9157_005333 [Trypethelium eluteriae]